MRDTDEIIVQKIPFWSRLISKCMVQGRLKFDAKDVPVTVGGVTIFPGDIVVGDGDEVVVVPREHAFEVAKYAHRELRNDKASRKILYEEVGLELDDTVK